MTPARIGTQQRMALDRLKWRPEVAAADDRVFVSLRRLGCVTSTPASGGDEWRITFAGCVALGISTPDEPKLEQAA